MTAANNGLVPGLTTVTVYNTSVVVGERL